MAAHPSRPVASARSQVPSARAGDGEGGLPRRPVRLARQHRPGWIAAGVALIALAVLANVYLFETAGNRLLVVRMVRDVAIGQPIKRADVGTASVAVDADVATIPARRLDAVIGRHAAVDLRRGSLLIASQLTTQLTPAPGEALVTAALKAGQLPPGGLAPGSRVRVMAVSAAPGQDGTPTAGSGNGTPAPVKDVPATVDAVGEADADGSLAVSLLVAEGDAGAVARQAASGQVVLVVTSRGA